MGERRQLQAMCRTDGHLRSRETDSDGRNGSLLTPGTAIAKNSIFKLTFYTKDYWTAKGVESFYPFVEVSRLNDECSSLLNGLSRLGRLRN